MGFCGGVDGEGASSRGRCAEIGEQAFRVFVEMEEGDGFAVKDAGFSFAEWGILP